MELVLVFLHLRGELREMKQKASSFGYEDIVNRIELMEHEARELFLLAEKYASE